MSERAREAILDRARDLIAGGGNPTVAEVAAAAGISRTTFYRAFESREALFGALEVEPEPGARERLLDAALKLVGAHGLAALSMDELATQADVSRATLYRLFPGKAALFTSMVRTYSPLEPVMRVIAHARGEPPEVVMPEIARTVYRTVYGSGENRIGMLRALLFEVGSMAPDTAEAAQDAIRGIFGSLAAYLITQMQDGRLRKSDPLLALQSFVGPVFFHLVTRPLAEKILGLQTDGEQAVTLLAETWLRAMRPEEGETHA